MQDKLLNTIQQFAAKGHIEKWEKEILQTIANSEGVNKTILDSLIENELRKVNEGNTVTKKQISAPKFSKKIISAVVISAIAIAVIYFGYGYYYKPKINSSIQGIISNSDTNTKKEISSEISNLKSEHKVETEIKIGDCILKINNVEFGKIYEEYCKPKDEKKNVAIEVILTNNGKKEIDYNVTEFTLTDENNYNYRYYSAFCQKDPFLSYGTLQSGHKTRGWITFEVDKSSKKLELLFIPDFAEQSYSIIIPEISVPQNESDLQTNKNTSVKESTNKNDQKNYSIDNKISSIEKKGYSFLLSRLKNPSSAKLIAIGQSEKAKNAIEKSGFYLKSCHSVVLYQIDATNSYGGTMREMYYVFFKNGTPCFLKTPEDISNYSWTNLSQKQGMIEFDLSINGCGCD